MISNRCIVLVEDNDDDVKLTLRVFRKINLSNKIIVLRDGVEALDYLFKRGAFAGRTTNPTVILLDLKLPRVDGMEVLRQIRANSSTLLIPVVVLTSSKEEQDLVDSYRLGANSYIRKPVKFDQFCDAIQQLGLYWLLLNEPAPGNRSER